MNEHKDSDLQTELAALRQRLGNLEAEHRELKRQAAHTRGPVFSRKFLLSALPIALLLAAGGVLYAVDALNIDNKGNATFIGNLGIGTSTTPSEKLQVSGGKIQLDGNQQIKFTDVYSSENPNNLQLQLWTGNGLGINSSTLFYAASGMHSWRDINGTNERMVLTTGANGGLTVKGTGNSSFAGNVGIGKTQPSQRLEVAGGNAVVNNVFVGDVGHTSYWAGFAHSKSVSKEGYGFLQDETGQYTLVNKKSGGGFIGFRIDNADKMVLADNGNVGIGRTDPQLPLDVNGWLGSSNSNQTVGGWRLGLWPGSPANQWVYLTQAKALSYANLAVGDLYVRGKITYQGKNLEFFKDVFNTELIRSSDQRLKKDLEEIPNPLEKVRKLRGITYSWNETGLQYFSGDIEHTISAGPNATEEANRALWQQERNKRYKELSKTNIGVIAQDVEAVLPEAVSTDEKGYKSVRYNYLIPLLIEAVKEQDKAMNEQTLTVERQQAEIERLAVAQQIIQQQLAELAAVKVQMARLEAAVQRGTAARSFVVPDALRQAFTAQAK